MHRPGVTMTPPGTTRHRRGGMADLGREAGLADLGRDHARRQARPGGPRRIQPGRPGRARTPAGGRDRLTEHGTGSLVMHQIPFGGTFMRTWPAFMRTWPAFGRTWPAGPGTRVGIHPGGAGIATTDQDRARPGPWTRTAPAGTGKQRTLARLAAWVRGRAGCGLSTAHPVPAAATSTATAGTTAMRRDLASARPRSTAAPVIRSSPARQGVLSPSAMSSSLRLATSLPYRARHDRGYSASVHRTIRRPPPGCGLGQAAAAGS